LQKTQIADGGLSAHPIYTFIHFMFIVQLQISISFREKSLYKQHLLVFNISFKLLILAQLFGENENARRKVPLFTFNGNISK